MLSSGSKQCSTTWSMSSPEGPHRLLLNTAASRHVCCKHRQETHRLNYYRNRSILILIYCSVAMVTHLVNRWGEDLGFTKFAGKRSINSFFHVVLKRWLVVGRWFIYSQSQRRSKECWNCTLRQCFYFRTQWREIYRVPGPGSHVPPSLWRWHSQQEWKQRTRKSCQAQQWCRHRRKEGSKGPPLTWLHYWPAKNVKHNWSRQNPMKGITLILQCE